MKKKVLSAHNETLYHLINFRINQFTSSQKLLKMDYLSFMICSVVATHILYKNMLNAGIAKECAREVLPMGTPTKLYMNGTLRSWIHYCDLRCGNGTQKEHRAIALDIKQLIKQNYPQVYEVISRFG